jgi:hypothetical protein
MKKMLIRLILPLSLFILTLFIVFAINETVQIVRLATAVSPGFGRVTFWGLLLIYAVFLAVPAVMFLRLPRSLNPPETDREPEFSAFLQSLGKRLAVNKHLLGIPVSTREEVEEALTILDARAREVTEKTASTIFLSTAISQSGRLDAFLVLAGQTRMIWEIAHLYYQRPTARELVHLYANVAATAFLASEIDDLDISEQIEPVIASTLGAAAISVPGFQLAASLVVNSILTGAANAFLTLRVGIITKGYCRSLVAPERKSLRRSAGMEAAKQLGAIVTAGAAKVSGAIWEASKDKAVKTFSHVAASARDTAQSVLNRIGGRRRKTVSEGQMDLLGEQAADSSKEEPRLPRERKGKPLTGSS